jgi:hypothetical protein
MIIAPYGEPSSTLASTLNDYYSTSFHSEAVIFTIGGGFPSDLTMYPFWEQGIRELFQLKSSLSSQLHLNPFLSILPRYIDRIVRSYFGTRVYRQYCEGSRNCTQSNRFLTTDLFAGFYFCPAALVTLYFYIYIFYGPLHEVHFWAQLSRHSLLLVSPYLSCIRTVSRRWELSSAFIFPSLVDNFHAALLTFGIIVLYLMSLFAIITSGRGKSLKDNIRHARICPNWSQLATWDHRVRQELSAYSCLRNDRRLFLRLFGPSRDFSTELGSC